MLVCMLRALDEAPLKAVLAEAESLGLPGLAGCTYVRGTLRLADAPAEGSVGEGDPPALHARLPDGRWLLHLAQPYAAGQLVGQDLAALQPLSDLSALRAPVALRWINADAALVALARQVQLGIPGAGEAFETMRRDVRTELSTVLPYPRLPTLYTAATPAESLRWALSRVFRTMQRGDAAVAIVPEPYRRAVAELIQRSAQGAQAPTDGPAGQLAAWRPRQRYDQPVATPPQLDADVLIALAGDVRPVAEPGMRGIAVGDVALSLLNHRWRIDPALCAGCDPAAPWDGTERARVAEGLRAWWAATAGKPLAERLLIALRPAEPQHLVAAATRRLGGDGYWPVAVGSPAAQAPADEDAWFVREAGAALAARWPDGPPAAPAAWLPQICRIGTHAPALATAIDGWKPLPWSAEALALWRDRRGHPQDLDALVEAWLAAPTGDSTILSGRWNRPDGAPATTGSAELTPLAWWIALPDARRWQRLQELLQADPVQNLAALRLQLTAGGYWASCDFGSGQGVAPALVWLALSDQRPAPPAMVEQAAKLVGQLRNDDCIDVLITHKAPAGIVLQGLRISDVAGLRIMRNLYGTIGYVAAERLIRRHPRILVELQSPEPAGRDAALGLLSRYLAAHARLGLTAAGLPIPPALAAIAEEVVVPGLTADESASCAAVLEQAMQLGFPRLDGATVHKGELVRHGGGTWWGPHVRLADGSWLADCLVPMAAARVREVGEPLLPSEPGIVPRSERLPESAITRSEVNWVLNGVPGEFQDGIVALAWWRGGADPTGRAVLAAAVLAEVMDLDRGSALVLDSMGHSAQERSVVAIPEPGLAVRRICARWFLDRMRVAEAAEDVQRWGDAAERMLASEDRESWGLLLARMRAAKALAGRPVGSALPARLAAWRCAGRDLIDGQWEGAAPPPPVTVADLDGLVALLGDTGPSLWWDDRMPRTLGDNALRCLYELTGADWRWLVVDDPAVAALVDMRLGEQVESPWSVQRWTDAQRTACATAIARWWAAHREGGAPAAIAAVLQRMPPMLWDDVFYGIPRDMMTDAVGAAIAAAIAATLQVPAEEPLPAIGAIRGALLLPRHAGITAALAAWPAGPGHAKLTDLRGQLGGTGAYDARILDLLQGRFAPPAESFHGWEPERMLDPDSNLGLWMHQPTPGRLQALVEAQQRPFDQPNTIWLLAQLGTSRHDVLGDWRLAERVLAGGSGRRAIPARLIELALADVRALPRDVSVRLATMAGPRDCPASWRDVSGPRVCDWAALQLMENHRRLGLDILPDGADRPADFRVADQAARDRALAALRSAFAPVVAEQLVEAGLAPARPAGASGF